MSGKVGIIGGSGLYDIDLEDKKEREISTPFGRPSENLIEGKLKGQDVVFLARHGKGHRILPSELNYKANIYAMKKLGVEHIISISAVGSLKKELKPQDFVLIDQYVDRTNMAREMTFFGDGIVAHISFSQPICPALRNVLYQACKDLGIKAHNGGTYVNIEGPAFSTKAESFLYKKWGMDVVGMTNLPEAKLAREAEICFAAITTVTDYDCWKEEEEEVTVEMILANLRKNTENTKSIIYEVIDKMPSSDECNCRNALKDTIITPAEAIPESTKKKLDIIIGKYIK